MKKLDQRRDYKYLFIEERERDKKLGGERKLGFLYRDLLGFEGINGNYPSFTSIIFVHNFSIKACKWIVSENTNPPIKLHLKTLYASCNIMILK